MKRTHTVRMYVLLLFVLLAQGGVAYSAAITGSIQGKVIDAETKSPLVGANVVVAGTGLGAATAADGTFVIPQVPLGSYVLQFNYIGYEALKKADVIVRPERITYVKAELKIAAMETDAISVTAGYFPESDEEPTSRASFSYEEIRRAPGSAGDVSRILMSLPSIAKVNDQSNNLIVRGGNPMENDFYIDNIEIPNINHFPQQGASGGPIGFLNVDFIQEVTFYSGGFSVLYGDRLSSVMELTFREGNRSEFDGQLDLNFSGFGGVGEGPMFGNKGSWLISARRSYLDFVVDVLDVGTTVAPSYGDIQAKLVYDINAGNKLILLVLFADDHNAPDRETAEENQMTYYGNQDIYQSTAGLNWRAIWGTKGYSNTSIAYTINKFNEDWYQTSTAGYAVKNRTSEQALKFRNVNHFRLNKKNTLEFGVEARQQIENYDNWYAQTTNDVGDPLPALAIKKNIHGAKVAGFLNYVFKPFSAFTTTLGLRADYFSYNGATVVSPRLSCSYRLTDKTSVNASTGVFYQSLPLLLLAQNTSNKSLKDAKAVHYVLGIEHLLSEDTKGTLEIYQKNYKNFPMDPLQPAWFIIDKNHFGNYGAFRDTGVARSRGVELMLQKKLAKDVYGLLSASYFRSQYKGLDGRWRSRDFDNRVTFSVQGGYKPNNKWEFSMRWIYAGGVPYTPFDVEKSKQNHRAVYDENKINRLRYPAYHSLNIRFDRRFNFSASNIVFYLSVWNAYNRKNVANYYWNDKEQKQDAVYQWGLLPIFGVEYEF